MKLKDNQQGIGPVIIVILMAVVLGVVGSVAYKVGKNSQPNPTPSSASQSTAPTTETSDKDQIASVLTAAACSSPANGIHEIGDIVVYKDFSTTDVHCIESDGNPGPGAIRILKKINGEWEIIGITHGCSKGGTEHGMTDEIFNVLYPSPEFDYCRE